MSNERICFIIPRGEVIRNFAYSGFLEQLKVKYELHIISITPNKQIREYLSNISDKFYELREEPLSHRHKYFIGLIDLAHNKYLWSEAAKVRWSMRDFEAKGLKSKTKRTFNKLLATSFATDGRLRFLENFLLKTARKEPTVINYYNLLSEIKPDLVFNGSHVHSKNAYPIIQAARLLKIKTCTFLFSWDNLTSQGRISPPYDHYFAWNSSIKRDMLRIYPTLKDNQVTVTGTPQFAFHFDETQYLSREKFLQSLGLKADEKYVLYSSGMSHHMPHEPDVAELLADQLAEINPNLKLVIRTYAKDQGDVFDALKDRRKDIIIPDVQWEKNYQTPLIEDQHFFTNLLLHCELGVNVASTISLELCMLDKPAINIGFNPPERNISPYDYTRFYKFDHYKPIVDSNAVTVTKSPAELKSVVVEYLKNPSLNKEHRSRLIQQFFEGRLNKGVIDNFLRTFGELMPR